MKKTLADYLSNIEDYRNGNAIRHNLMDILIITILAVICGADYWTEIEQFGNAKKDWLNTFLKLPNGIPSADTIARVLAKIDTEEFHNAFIKWVNSISELIDGQVISIDGKTLRRSKDKSNGKKAIHVVSAWASENNLVLGQLKVDEKSNEITAIPELLKMLDIEGCIITIDAMGTQKDIAETIVKNKGDYILALKENHEILYKDVELYFEEEILTCNKKELKDKGMYYVQKEQGHGRFEKREYYISNEIDWLWQREEWTGLTGIGLCIRECEEGTTKSVEYRYFLYSIKGCTAQKFGKSIRKHWGIENSLHWLLDMAFREDESRIRKENSAENMNIIRHMALNLLKQEKTAKVGIKSKRLKCAWDHDYLKKVLNLQIQD